MYVYINRKLPFWKEALVVEEKIQQPHLSFVVLLEE
jgi:hypothetical protein